ncbi:MAG: hypothetical protein JW927_04080 [Deltaproteobacteria bacterium]|nr:hypothetical protein [Deltaproteobacteria bacterium]
MVDLVNWLIIVISYFSSVICSMLLFTARTQIPEQTVYIIFWLGLFVGTIGLIIQARKDLYNVCIFTTVSGFLATVIFSSIIYYGTVPHPVATSLAVAGALLMITNNRGEYRKPGNSTGKRFPVFYPFLLRLSTSA